MAGKSKSGELRIISPKPVLAEILAQRKPLLIGEEGYYWLVDWIARIGTILRNRDTIAYTIANMILNAGITVGFELTSEYVPILRRLRGGE